MKVALVGVGGMGGCHFEIYKNMKNVELIALCDVRYDMLKEKAQGCDAHLYSDFDELLANEKPELIDICTPTYLHMEQSIKALESGANVLCEKPMALNSTQAKKLLDAASKTDKLFMTAHVVRFMNAYKYLKSVIDSGSHGKLLRLDMKRIGSIPMWSFENWMQDEKKSGHAVLDLMIHDIDFVQYVFGMPKDISGVYYGLKNLTNYASADYIYDGFSVSMECGWYKTEIPFTAEYKAIFEDGYVKLRDGKVYDCGNEINFSDATKIGDIGINISNVDGYDGEIAYFISCIENGEKPGIVTPQSSSDSITLVEKTREKLINL